MGQILIVEDDADIRESLLESLEGLGHAVTLAANGREGVEALARVGRPCLVLLDVMMPELDGAGFLAELVRRADVEDFRVVVMSADPASIRRIKGLPGIVRFLDKPIDLDELLALVANHCGAPRE
ncbi:MAG TPA: response regulator [Kineosporiaceae bacterium]|nr:response regulator [Kineosporiaceae bacterium]